MSLDQNLFTLHLKPNEKDVNVVDLVDPSGTVHYRKRRIRDGGGGGASTGTGTSGGGTQSATAPAPAATPGGYKVEVYDPMSDSLLVTATALAASSKLKTLELCNPTQIVELKSTGTLSFKWAFQWEDNQYEWKKEACYMVRKPDPPVVVAVTREIPASKGVKTTSVQILDYNLNRFDIEDRKGLEIVILTSLMTFHDTGAPATEAPAAPTGGSGGVAVLGLSMPSLRRDNTTSSATGASNLSAVGNAKAPTPPPKPAPKTGVDRIADMQAMKEEVNVITVEDEGDIEDYAHYCCKLLEDDAMLFITVRSAAGEQVPKVLQVVEETRRQRHKAGLDEDEQLHQYVLYDTIPAQKGPKRINLDDDNKKSKQKYTPPNSLTVHISKIPMPELQPKASTAGASHSNLSKKDSKKKDDKYATKPPAPIPSSSSDSSRPNHLSRPSSSNTPPRTHSHQVHPNQPSPSPSQLNNPGIYAAPPPQPNHHTRPSAPYNNNNGGYAPPGPGGWGGGGNRMSFYPGSVVPGNSYMAPFQPPYPGGPGYGPPPGPPPRHPTMGVGPPFGHPPPPPGASGPLPPQIGYPPPPPGQGGALNAGGSEEQQLAHKPSGLFGFLRR